MKHNQIFKSKKLISQIPENAVFWLILFSLAVGSASSLYQKITDRAETYEVHTEHISAAPVSNSMSVISLHLPDSPELSYPCLITSVSSGIR